jgi:hypothetical protein
MERGKVDLSRCVAGDILISALGAKLEYVSRTKNGEYLEHKVRYLVDPDGKPYPKDSMGTRTNDGYVFRYNRIPETDHDIVKIHYIDESFGMRDEIESIVIDIFSRIGCDLPDNWENIVQFVYEDVLETADNNNWEDILDVTHKNNWNNDDVIIGFRRWIESKS